MTRLRPAAFAVPGDITTLTGGYIYERRLLMGLRDQGRDVTHLQLPATFPDADADQMAMAVAQLRAVPPARALILDGLVFGAIDPAGLATVRAPMLAMIHHPLALESGLSPDRRAYLFATERQNLRHVRHVLVPSPRTKSVLIHDYAVTPDRITIARPGTDRPVLRPARVSPPLILSVGIQHPRKGHDILINALAKITDLDWQAVIVGRVWDRDHADALAALVREKGLGAHVILAGQVDGAVLQKLYAQASLFALATRYEGYGIVFDEAIAAALPVVSCAVGAVPDTVPADAGLLVQPDDATAFSAALRRLLQHPDERAALALAAVRHAASLPRWQDTAHIAGTVLDGPDFD